MPRTQQEIQDIQNIVTIRAIPYLVHFTRLENLYSILNNGLVPRAVIDNSPKNSPFRVVQVNDEIRVDYKTTFNCASIGFPNCRMFYKYRQLKGAGWVILLLRPKILWEKNCLFYPVNAASATVSYLPIAQFSTAQALENMFAEQRDPWLQPHDPTDVQAEVMIEGIIEPNYIGICLFETQELANQYAKEFPNIKMLKHDSMYSNRQYARERGFHR